LSEHHEHPTTPFQRPSLPCTSQIDRYLDLSREEHWFSNEGPCWRLLRDRLADRAGAYCVPVASGTLGLMVAIASVLDTRPSSARSVCVMPSFTFLATAQAALWSGLEPMLIDVDPGHWHMDAQLLERVLPARNDVRAVLAVSAFGTPPPAETRLRWQAACRASSVPLVVDSAAGFGAVADDNTPIGAQGDVEVVSFHATKPFAIGEGGAVFTRDRTLHERITMAVNFGFRPDRSVGFTRGLNAKMSELHAATALAVLDEFDPILETRKRAVSYLRGKAGSHVTWQSGCERSTWQFVPVAFTETEQREQALRYCRHRVEIRTYYDPLHTMPSSRKWFIEGDLANTDDLYSRILCLPMANDLNASELEVIALALTENPSHEQPTGSTERARR
jgi:dTDP-4-amino-4,6-dideoxygalactose transaminase